MNTSSLLNINKSVSQKINIFSLYFNTNKLILFESFYIKFEGVVLATLTN